MDKWADRVRARWFAANGLPSLGRACSPKSPQSIPIGLLDCLQSGVFHPGSTAQSESLLGGERMVDNRVTTDCSIIFLCTDIVENFRMLYTCLKVESLEGS